MVCDSVDLTGGWADALAEHCRQLQSLDLSWLSLVDGASVVRNLDAMALTKLNLFESNTFTSVFFDFEAWLESSKKGCALEMVGGLDRAATHAAVLSVQTGALARAGITATRSSHRSICEKQWQMKCATLAKATRLTGAVYVFDVPMSSKIYVVFNTDTGAFGLKLAPTKDFVAEDKMAHIRKLRELQRRDRPAFLSHVLHELAVPMWPWTDGYQGVRGFVLIGMETNSWIRYSINTFYGERCYGDASDS